MLRRAVCVVTLAGLGMLAAVALLNLTVFIEATVPEHDDLPELPEGLTAGAETTGCGSGSCYREFEVEGPPGESAESILGRLPAEECSANSLVDRRPRCVDFHVRAGEVVGYVSLGKWLS